MASHIKNIRTSQLSFFHLFIRFLKFGFLAWGGPIAQIDMIRKEIVEELLKKETLTREEFLKFFKGRELAHSRVKN